MNNNNNFGSKKEKLIEEKITEERIKERSSKLDFLPVDYYVLKAINLAVSPADASTHYFGSIPIVSSTTADLTKYYVPLKAKLVRVDIFCQASANTSNENLTYYVRKNNTSDINLGTANFGGTRFLRLVKNNLSEIFADTDYFEIKVVCPTWATNPTNWVHNVNLLFEVL